MKGYAMFNQAVFKR